MEASAALATVRRPSPRVVAGIAWLSLTAAAFAAAAFAAVRLEPLPGPNEYNIPAWVARNFLDKWLYKTGELFRGRPSPEEQERYVRDFFLLSREVFALEERLSDAMARGGTDPALAAELRRVRDRRDRLENRVESIIEGRITAVAESEGLALRLAVLPDIVWPPVNMEFTTSPRTLAVSPRDRIALQGTTLLREDLTLEEVERLERRRLEEDGLSALAFPTSGVGAYPTIISFTGDYRSAVETAAHEWVHNHLYFFPLGVRYFESSDLRTLNESVADLAGREIAEAVMARWPVESLPPPERRPAPTVDVRAELRALRAEAESLLAEGRIEEAEALMEERRQHLAANGYFLRRINQAYFAFTNLYAGRAGSPAAVNPIGPKVDDLRRRTASLGEFLTLVRGFTSVADLDRALRERGAAP
jgi:hypothetical protein